MRFDRHGAEIPGAADPNPPKSVEKMDTIDGLDLSKMCLDDAPLSRLKECLRQNKDVFSVGDMPGSVAYSVEHEINVGAAKPIAVPKYHGNPKN